MSKIKQLQNNFTTPEQSKRLLELGVPADSADCFFTKFEIDNEWTMKFLFDTPYSKRAIPDFVNYMLPCWSVGRLMVIYFISKGLDYWSPQFKKYQIENSAEYFVALIEENIKDLDFSKLEE